MRKKNYFLNHGPCASSEEMARLAINPDWCCNADDPRNARYLRPLSIVADEKMANGMADIVYGAVAEEHGNDRTFNSDKVYRQCLVDARHSHGRARLFDLSARAVSDVCRGRRASGALRP